MDKEVEKLNDFLEHYGVPGMRWGVRRLPGVGKSLSGRTRASWSKFKKTKLGTFLSNKDVQLSLGLAVSAGVLHVGLKSMEKKFRTAAIVSQATRAGLPTWAIDEIAKNV